MKRQINVLHLLASNSFSGAENVVCTIIQNNKIIGVVNYVVVTDANKGYGIFIKKMLEEGDKLLNS